MAIKIDILEKKLEDALSKETTESMNDFFNDVSTKELSHNPMESYNIIKDKLQSVLDDLSGFDNSMTDTADKLKDLFSGMPSTPQEPEYEYKTVTNDKESRQALYNNLNDLLRQAREGMQSLNDVD